VEVNGERVPLLSGEVHYWRLAPEMWRPILRRVAEMGIRVVASYVCWDFHEVGPGQWDFEGMGDPRRDLLTFLRLLAEEDFWVILRPGPYIYSEWRNGGVPDRVAGWHRLHPEFLAAAEAYMAAAGGGGAAASGDQRRAHPAVAGGQRD
jgi:beta-galactosidase